MKNVFLTAVLCIFLSACGGETLYTNLSEKEANTMVALLRTEGVSAKKATKAGAWTVTAPSDDFVLAIDTLRRHNLPGREYKTLDVQFAKAGMVSTELEIRARFIVGKQEELARSIEMFDGVVSAVVNLSIPERRALSRDTPKSKASVMVTHLRDFEMAQNIGAIQNIVASGVEGLEKEDVIVETSAIQRMMLNNANATKATGSSTQLQRIGFPALFALAGLIVGWFAFSLWRGSRTPSTTVATVGHTPPREAIDKQDDADTGA